MTEQKKLVEPERVSCVVCFKEIPISEAKSVKATDYIMYYCGLDCYDNGSSRKRSLKNKKTTSRKLNRKNLESPIQACILSALYVV